MAPHQLATSLSARSIPSPRPPPACWAMPKIPIRDNTAISPVTRSSGRGLGAFGHRRYAPTPKASASGTNHECPKLPSSQEWMPSRIEPGLLAAASRPSRPTRISSTAVISRT